MTATASVPAGPGPPRGQDGAVTAAAGTGIGFATAKRCVEEGAQVVITDVHERRLRESAEELGVHGIVANVTSEVDVQRCFAESIEALGHLDVLVNNAGLGGTARARRDDRRAVVERARRDADRHDAHDARRAARTCTSAVRARS